MIRSQSGGGGGGGGVLFFSASCLPLSSMAAGASSIVRPAFAICSICSFCCAARKHPADPSRAETRNSTEIPCERMRGTTHCGRVCVWFLYL